MSNTEPIDNSGHDSQASAAPPALKIESTVAEAKFSQERASDVATRRPGEIGENASPDRRADDDDSDDGEDSDDGDESPTLGDLLDNFSDAMSIVETAWYALESNEEENPLRYYPAIATLRFAVELLNALYLQLEETFSSTDKERPAAPAKPPVTAVTSPRRIPAKGAALAKEELR